MKHPALPLRPTPASLASALMLAAGWWAAASAHAQAAATAASCRAVATQMPTVVEFYTSEGCSSCPPADRWASTLKGRKDVLALGFHVNYWDRLGWPDRFASPEITERQHLLAQAMRSHTVYTPQVVVNGQDWRRWPGLPAAGAANNRSTGATGTAVAAGSPAEAPTLELLREGDRVTARIGAGPARAIAGYWAVLEDQHLTRVRAGENSGETLHHDHVVRLYKPLGAWNGDKAQQVSLQVSAGAPEYPRRVAFVVTDAVSLRPLQAVALPIAPAAGGC